MKFKRLLPILVLSASFLVACGDQNGTSSDVAKPDITIASDDSSTGDSKNNPVAWSENDLTVMSGYLTEGIYIPFPLGVTEKYTTEYSGFDEEDGNGVCFILVDSACGDLTVQYGAILSENGYTYDENNSSEGSDEDYAYYCYYKDVTTADGADCALCIQTDYNDYNEFEIYAWLESYETNPTYEEFPYEMINSTLGLSLSGSNFPSFELAEGEKYDGYSDDTGEYYYVGGYFDENTTDDDYVSAYETKLTEKGFVVSSEDGAATNAVLGVKIEYVAVEGYFLAQFESYVVLTPGDYTMTFLAEDFPDVGGGYNTTDTDLKKGNIKFKYAYAASSAGYIQFKKTLGYMYNVTDLGKINSIVVTASSKAGNYYGALSLYVDSSIINEVDSTKEVTPTVDGLTYTYTVTSDVGYFYLIDEANNASKNDSIVINYTIE